MGSGLDGTTITLAANTFSEPGYTFAGWNDGAATYAGATYTLASNGSAIVLTATWTANATDAYSYYAHRARRSARFAVRLADAITTTILATAPSAGDHPLRHDATDPLPTPWPATARPSS